MNAILKEAKKLACEKFGEITVIPGRSWEECVTVMNGVKIFWFNTPDGSTHIIKM